MEYKIRVILNLAAIHEHDCIVLSAFGCGAYRNPPNEVANIFFEKLRENEYNGRFSKVIFAIFNDHNACHEYSPDGNIVPFVNVFGQETVYSLDLLK